MISSVGYFIICFVDLFLCIVVFYFVVEYFCV